VTTIIISKKKISSLIRSLKINSILLLLLVLVVISIVCARQEITKCSSYFFKTTPKRKVNNSLAEYRTDTIKSDDIGYGTVCCMINVIWQAWLQIE